nr:MAG TPA: hypothetical protein [Caudoviricetes sp.]
MIVINESGAVPDFFAAESLNMSRINFSCNYIPDRNRD